MKVVGQLVTSDQYFEVLDLLVLGAHMGGFNLSGMRSVDPLSAVWGEEERQKLMAMHEKKENGDKEADHHGHGMDLGWPRCVFDKSSHVDRVYSRTDQTWYMDLVFENGGMLYPQKWPIGEGEPGSGWKILKDAPWEVWIHVCKHLIYLGSKTNL